MDDDEADAARSLQARRRPRSGPLRQTPGRFWRRIGLVMVLVVVAVATQRHSFQAFSDRLFGAPINWSSDYAMSVHLYDMIERQHLTDVPKACLLLNIHGGDPPRATTLDVYERPTQACLGPAHSAIRVLPRLFQLRVDRTAGRVESDSGTPGVFRPLN